MWESGNPLSLAAGHCWLIKESTHRWNINTATAQQTLIEENLCVAAERQKAPGFAVSCSESVRWSASRILLSHRDQSIIYRQLLLQHQLPVISLQPLTLQLHWQSAVVLVANNNSDLMLILGRGAVYTNFTVGLCEPVWTQKDLQSLVSSSIWVCGWLELILNSNSKVMSDWQNEEFLVVRGDFKGLGLWGRYCTQ